MSWFNNQTSTCTYLVLFRPSIIILPDFLYFFRQADIIRCGDKLKWPPARMIRVPQSAITQFIIIIFFLIFFPKTNLMIFFDIFFIFLSHQQAQAYSGIYIYTRYTQVSRIIDCFLIRMQARSAVKPQYRANTDFLPPLDHYHNNG